MRAARAEGWPASTRESVTWVTDDDAAWRRQGTVRLEAVVPPAIATLTFAVPGDVAAACSNADAALARLDGELAAASAHALDAAASHLIRAEGLSSSRIEGLDLSARRLAEADRDPIGAGRLAREVAANVSAMLAALELGTQRAPLGADDVRDLHGVLMAGVPGVRGGEYRHRQNWIGSSNNPAEAIYVPPPVAHIERLVADVAGFANRTDLSPSLQAAIAHAQFEAIHPFIDGNGRVGRCLIGVVIRKRTGTAVFPPVSAGLRRDVSGYFADLQRFQQDADPWPWVRRFAAVTVDACGVARSTIRAIGELQATWRQRAGRPREGSIAARLIDILPSHSTVDADQVASLLTVDPATARRGLNALEGVGVLRQVTSGRRNRVWRADELHDLLDSI